MQSLLTSIEFMLTRMQANEDSLGQPSYHIFVR